MNDKEVEYCPVDGPVHDVCQPAANNHTETNRRNSSRGSVNQNGKDCDQQTNTED